MRSVALAAIVAGTAATASAVPAYRGVVKVTQPDGTEISVRQTGDERCHFKFTEDGYLLETDSEGRLVYASILSDGSIRPSSIMARDKAQRSASDLKFLGGISAEMTRMAIDARMEKASSPFRITRAEVPTHYLNRGLCNSTFKQNKGEVKGIVILVEYSDVKMDSENAYKGYSDYQAGADAYTYFNDFLNKEGFDGFGSSGSVRDWFLLNSRDAEGDSQFSPTFDVFGPVTLPQKRSYYGGNDAWGSDKNPQKMVTDALDILLADTNSNLNLADYDNDGDGEVDNIYIIYAGQGEADSSVADSVWPHSWTVGSGKDYNGVTVYHYGCNSETNWKKMPDGIATFIHEFSHVIGLPDLYNTTNSYATYTPGMYSVLDYGPYNNDGLTPPNYSAYERYALDWLKPLEVPYEADIELPNLADSNVAYMVRTERTDNTGLGTASVNEYFLFENRQLTGWDAYIPGHGMLIWHIDYSKTHFEGNTVNNASSHCYVDLVEANGIAQASAKSPYPGTGNYTTCTFKSWAGKDCGVTLSDITEDTSAGIVKMHAVNINGDSGVEGIESDSNGEAEYFNLQGLRVSRPEAGQLLIRLQNGKASKILF